MTRVGIVGLGFMGMVHYLTYKKIPGIEVVAICESRRSRLEGDWTDIRGNFGPPGEQMDLSEVATYEAAEDLIADSNVDLVDITLPPSLHKDVAIQSLQAGKHVFCEKPMALTVEDCDQMLAAAAAAGRELMIGHVLPFFPEYDWALREIRSESYGRLLGGSFKRVISDPSWLPNFWQHDAIGGPMLDLHIHDAHFIRLLFGEPTAVTTRGSLRNNLAEHWNSLFEFGDQRYAQATSGVINQQGRSFLHGFEIHLERATLAFEFAVMRDQDGNDVGSYLCPPTLLDDTGTSREVQLGDGDPMLAFQAELSHVASVLAGQSEANLLSGQLARDAIKICQSETEDLRASCS